MVSPAASTDLATPRSSPRTGVLLVIAALCLTASVEELSVRGTGALPVHSLRMATVAALLLGAWFGNRLPWRISATILVVSASALALLIA